MDEKTKRKILRNIDRLRSATTSDEIKRIEKETIQIIKSRGAKDFK